MTRTFSPYLTLALCCCLGLSLTACGQRGPLYLPEKQPPPQDTATEPESDESSEDSDEADT